MEDAVKDQFSASGNANDTSCTERSSSKLVRAASELNVDDSSSDSKRLKKVHSSSMADQDSFLMDHVINSGAQQLLYDQADVSLTLAKHLMLNYGKDSNLVFSPISIQVILALIAAGSSAQTLEQLLSFLKAKTIHDLTNLYSYLVATVFSSRGKKNKSSRGICFSFANGVWLDKSVSFKPPFKEVVETLYKAASHQVDFQNKAGDAINSANSWVTDKTGGLVKEMISPGSVDDTTRIVFANALYFKGGWASVFDESETKRYKFHLLNGESIKVPFMTSDKVRHVRAFKGFKVLKLPYKQARNDERSFSMYIFLPNAKDGLSALVEKAGSESEFFNHHIPEKEVKVGKFRIPKFKFEYEVEVSAALKKLGLVLPFDPNVGLSEIVDEPIPYIVSNIFQTSLIEVNEEGTEAAASTRFRMLGGCGMPRKVEKVIDFVADHPFLFVIREDTSRIVHFIGHVLNPSLT